MLENYRRDYAIPERPGQAVSTLTLRRGSCGPGMSFVLFASLVIPGRGRTVSRLRLGDAWAHWALNCSGRPDAS